MRTILLALSLVALSCGVSAQTSIPNTFAAGTPARAAEVNANFQALATAINTLTTRVAKLEGSGLTAADIAGTYAVTGMQMGLIPSVGTPGAGTNQGLLESISYSGTLTLTAGGGAGGTSSGNVTEAKNSLRWVFNPTGPSLTTTLTPSTQSEALSGSWTLTGNRLSLGGIDYHGAAGGRVFIGALSNPTDGSNVLLVAVRIN